MSDSEGMAYEVLDVENGDVLATYSTLDDARASLVTRIEKHPDVADHTAIAIVDASGHAVETIPASALQGRSDSR
jgi:hypothetical protein